MVALVCAAAFVAFVALATDSPDLPVYWHSNSGGQTVEVLRGRHNFRQPLLLVTVAKAAVALRPGAEDKQQVDVVGRKVAATLGGLAVVALTLFGWQLCGLHGALAAAGVLAVASPLVFWSHFFKEDSALVFGFAVSWLALAVFWERRSRGALLLLGIACGLACAGKYLGVLATAFALPVALGVRRARPAGRAGRLAVFAGGWLAAFALANPPMLADPRGFLDGLGYEIGHVSAGFTGKGYREGGRTPSLARYAQDLRENAVAPIPALALAWLATLPLRRRRGGGPGAPGAPGAPHAPEWALAAFGIVFFALVSQSSVQSARHLLPFWVWLHLLAALALAEGARWLGARGAGSVGSGVALAAGLALVLWPGLARTLERNAEFDRNSRLLLRRFVAESLPADARIAADWHAGLPDPEARHHDWPQAWLAQPIATATEVSDLGSLEDLVRDGFTHVVAEGGRLDRLERAVPVEAERVRHERRLAFYQDLASRAEPLWDSRETEAPRGGFNGRWLVVSRLPPPGSLPALPDPVGRLEERLARGEVAPRRVPVVLLVVASLRADRTGGLGGAASRTPALDAFAARATRFAHAFAAESAARASAASLLTSTHAAEHRVRYETPRAEALAGRRATLAELLAAAGWHTLAAVSGPAFAPEVGLATGFARYEHVAPADVEAAVERLLASAPPDRPVFLLVEAGDTGLPYGARSRFDAEQAGEARAAYDAELREADARIGRLLRRLGAAGLDPSNAVFVLTALHGEELFDPRPGDRGGVGNGRTLFQEQIRVPLVLSVPGVAPAGAVDESVSLLDVAPTVLDALSLAPEALPGLRGRSLLAHLRGEPLPPRAIHSGGLHGRAAWLDEGWAYHRYSRRDRSNPGLVLRRGEDGHFYGEALYDLREDPGETRDRAEDSRERLARLRGRLEAHERSLVPPPVR